MLIVCAGRSRSGSTLMYNLVRLTLTEFVGKSSVYGRGINHYKKNRERKYNIVKLHDSDDKYFEKNADYVFSCQRNESDQRKSILKFRKLMKNQSLNKESLDEFIKYDYKRYIKWANHKTFVKIFEYNDLVNNKEKVIKKISRVLLGINIIDDVVNIIIDKVDNLKMPSKKQKNDPETCLTWHHTTGDIK